MKKNFTDSIWGIIITAIGVILLGNVFDLWNVKIFFDGWWTLFIIIPSIYSVFRGNYVGGTCSLIIGLLLFLAANDVITYSVIVKAFWPFILIMIGLSLIVKPKRLKNEGKYQPSYIAVMGGSNEKINDTLKDTSVVAVMGAVELDISSSKVSSDVTINVTSVLGGVEIRVPNDVNVVTSGMPILGGVDNTHKNSGKHTIYINYTCALGGIEIK